MGFIKIDTISFQPVPTEDKVVTVMYRLTSDPDVPASYTIVTTTLNVPVGGVLATPFFINGLSDATSYTVKVKSNCGTYELQSVFTTGTGCVSLTGIYTEAESLIAYWGWKSTADVLSDYEIAYSPNYQYITATQDIECDFSGGSASPQYLWMAEPIEASQKYKWEDIVEPYNNGSIGTDQDLFDTPTVTPNFRFYITVYPTQQDNQISFNTT